MKRSLDSVLLAIVLFIPLTFCGQEKASVPDSPAPSVAATQALKPVVASTESQIAILKAERELSNVKEDLAEVTIQFNNLQKAADQLNPRYKEDQAKEKSAQAAVDAALDAVYKANGLSKDKYNFDPANFTFTPKPETPPAPKVAQVAPAAAK